MKNSKTIEEKLRDNEEVINGALDSLLPNSNGDSKEEAHSVIYEAMRYSAMSGGKRIRPFLTLEFCRLFGGDIMAALPYAAAVECIHTYSLVHDDLPCMDDDDERRGKPTSHRKFGEANALLAGDALLTYAFSLIADNPFADAKRNCRAVSVLASSAGHDGMIGGQVCDILYENDPDITFEKLAEMQRKKTGDLIAAASLLGVIAADPTGELPESVYSDVRRYAYNIGLTFQIIDDILDADDNGGAEEGKTTILSFMGIEEAKALAMTLTQNAIEAIKNYPGSEVLTELAVWLLKRSV